MSIEAYIFMAVIFGGFALGDTVGTLTHGKISGVFTSLIFFLIGYLTHLIPEDILTKAGIAEIANVSVLILIFHMGTLIKVQEFLKEWRTVLVTIIAMLSALAGVIGISALGLLDMKSAIVAIPILNGGTICANIMIDRAMDKGLSLAAAFGAVIFSSEKLFGSLPTSIFGQREARKIVAQMRSQKNVSVAESNNNEVVEKKKCFYERFDKFYTLDMCLFICAIFALLALWASQLTGINSVIFALVLGVTANQLGIVPPQVLDRCKSSGILISILYATIIPSLAAIHLSDFLQLGWMVVMFFVGSFAGILLCLFVLPGWKIVGSRDLAIGIAMAQFLGFPHTMILAKESARIVGETQEEIDAIEAKLVPAFVIAGMASVTTLSIVIAGIMVKFL